jgi:hypothetical protein
VTARATWFQRIPRRFFRFGPWHFAVYVAIGYLITGFLHYRIWVRGASVQTVLSNLGFTVPPTTPQVAMALFAIWSALVGTLFLLLLRKLRSAPVGIELVFWGSLLSVGGALVPWLFASSVTNTVFLFLFGMCAVVAFGIQERLRERSRRVVVIDAWKALVHAIKGSVAILALLLGGVATTVLLPWRNTPVEAPELFRYAALSAFLCLGLLSFLLMPLLTLVLETSPTEPVELEPPGVV